MKWKIWILGLFSTGIFAQESPVVRASLIILDSGDNPIENALVFNQDHELLSKTNHKGLVEIEISTKRSFIQIQRQGYLTYLLNLDLLKQHLFTMNVVLVEDPLVVQLEEQLSLSDAFVDLDEEVGSYLNSYKDLFSRKAAFDWGSSFFKRRGLNRNQQAVLINGIKMNTSTSGTALWSQWGGLNDLTKNQVERSGLSKSIDKVGGLGSILIDLNPRGLRKGTKLTTSLSNRSYTGRLILSKVGELKSKLHYAASMSTRIANQGYKKGTPYESFSFMSSLSYDWNTKTNTSFHFISVDQTSGKSSPLTLEEFNLFGKDYNPNWGLYKSKVRSAKLGKVNYQTGLIAHQYQGNQVNFDASLLLQKGWNTRSRIAYYNAENPYPNYFKKLPSFYVNSSLGANYYSANYSAESLDNYAQISWDTLYRSNLNAANNEVYYAIIDDVQQERRTAFQSHLTLDLSKHITIELRASKSFENNQWYAKAEDLLGGMYLLDQDPFSNTSNNLFNDALKSADEILGYHYFTNSSESIVSSLLTAEFNSWLFFLGGYFQHNDFERKGLFKNERFPNHSFGKSKVVQFKTDALQLGMRYGFDFRNYLEFNYLQKYSPPTIRSLFVNPRENNFIHSIKPEEFQGWEFNYLLRWRELQGKISLYNYRISNQSSIRNYYVHTALGSAFVSETSSGMGTQHKGIELSMTWNASPSFSVDLVSSVGQFNYVNNPSLTLYLLQDIEDYSFDTVEKSIDLGVSNLFPYHMGAGPEQVHNLSFNYRAPGFWFTSLSFNRMSNQYIDVSRIKNTESFLSRSDVDFDLTPTDLSTVFKQTRQEPYYLTNLVFGKSFLKNDHYISLFLSIDNVFDTLYYSGGYEQSRMGTIDDYLDDHRSGTPSFGNKYWWSNGRRYFLNLSISL